MRRSRKGSWRENNVLLHIKRKESEGGKKKGKKIVIVKLIIEE
jgi:hypothetical protein